MARRSTKRDLTKDKILASASALIEAGGIDALTMRKLAADLGIEAMSLYNHIKNKDELLEAVAERMVGAVVLPASTGDWRKDVRAYAYAFRAAALASPKVTQLVLSRQMFTTTVLQIADGMLRALQQGGLSVRDSVFAGRNILTYLAGTLVRELPRNSQPLSDSVFNLRRGLMTESGLPTVAAAADYLAVPPGDEEFQFGLELIIGALDRKGRSP